MRVFTGMNSNVQRYFDSSTFSSHGFHSTKPVRPAINLPTHGMNNGSKPDVTSSIAITSTVTEEVLVFATPFAYKPSWNATNLEDYGGYNVSTEHPCPGVFDHAIVDYGYVPQAFIEFMTQEFPEITSRFPPGATLLPGGPSIMDGIEEIQVAPASLDKEEDLTVSTAFTIRNTGCFHPDVCLANDDAPNTAATTTVSTAQSLIQRPNYREAIPTQASKTTFLPSFADTQRETSVLKSSAVASKASVASSAETALPTGEASITAKAAPLPPQSPLSLVWLSPELHLLLANVASLAETAHPVGEASITAKAAALPPQSPLSVVLLDSKSHLVPAGVTSSAKKAHPAGEVSISTEATALPPQSPSSVVLLNPESPMLLAGVASLAETARESPITTKAAALPPQSPSSVYLQNPESKLLLELERVIQESFATYLLPSVGLSQLIANAAPKDILDGQTFSPAAGSPIAVSKTTSGLAPQVSALVTNDGMTSRLPGNPGPVIKIGSQYLTAHSAFEYTLGSKTLVAGSTPIVVSGTTYSLAAHASALIVNGVTSPLSPFSEVKISTQYLTLGPRLGYILGSKTLIPGTTPIVFSGTTYSLDLEASILVANGVTSILHEQKTASTSLPGSNPTGSGRLQYILAGQTLSPGLPAITVSGIVVSLAALGNTVVIDGTPFPLSTGTTPSLTIGSQLLIATPASDLLVSDQMSQVGSATSITSNGTARITPSATNVVTGSTNYSLSTLTTSSTSGGVPPVSIITSKASRGRFCFTQMLRLSLVVLGLTLLQAS